MVLSYVHFCNYCYNQDTEHLHHPRSSFVHLCGWCTHPCPASDHCSAPVTWSVLPVAESHRNSRVVRPVVVEPYQKSAACLPLVFSMCSFPRGKRARDVGFEWQFPPIWLSGLQFKSHSLILSYAKVKCCRNPCSVHSL